MKNLLLLAMLVITLTSCKKNEVDELKPSSNKSTPPTIYVFQCETSTGSSIFINWNTYSTNGVIQQDTANFKHIDFNILADAGIKNIEIIQADKNNNVNNLTFVSGIINQNQNYSNQTYWRGAFRAENLKTYLAPYIIVIKCTDNNNQITEKSITINFKF